MHVFFAGDENTLNLIRHGSFCQYIWRFMMRFVIDPVVILLLCIFCYLCSCILDQNDVLNLIVSRKLKKKSLFIQIYC